MIGLTKERLDHNKRWVEVSLLYGSKEFPYFLFDIQQLGQTEFILLELEKQAKELIIRQKQEGYDFSREPYPFLMSQLLGLSKYWMFGLYEVLRKFRETQSTTSPPSFPAPFDGLNDLFWDIEVIRMPLAKYEAAKIKDSLCWPEFHFLPETGSCGWNVFCKKIMPNELYQDMK